jgi:hypothetical protein
MIQDLFRKRYNQQKSNAKMRGVEFLFTFEEWKDWWIATGKWEQRGKLKGQYVMCRYGDIGYYSLDNVFCGTTQENVRDGNLGKEMTISTRNKISAFNKGQPHPWSAGDKNPMHRPEVKVKISIAVGGSNNYRAKTVICPFGIFGSTTEASKELNVPAETIQWRCRHNKSGWSSLR